MKPDCPYDCNDGPCRHCRPCPTCNGEGMVPGRHADVDAYDETDCPRCGGTGVE